MDSLDLDLRSLDKSGVGRVELRDLELDRLGYNYECLLYGHKRQRTQDCPLNSEGEKFSKKKMKYSRRSICFH
jgi:hypothetical protein